jgi:hypothetical protein
MSKFGYSLIGRYGATFGPNCEDAGVLKFMHLSGFAVQLNRFMPPAGVGKMSAHNVE